MGYVLNLKFVLRYAISLAVADWSGQAWLQGFNDVGIAVFGMPANELVEMKVCLKCCSVNPLSSLMFFLDTGTERDRLPSSHA